MLIREITSKDKLAFDQAATHPLQAYAWGEFRKKTGLKVERVGMFEGSKLMAGVQVTIHPIPKTAYMVGYFPRGTTPNDTQLRVLQEIGERNNCILVKLEPNIATKAGEKESGDLKKIREFLTSNGCQRGRSLFTKYTFRLDLTRSEEQLMAQMKSKTRYNVRLAQRHNVSVEENNSLEAFEWYLRLTEATTKRQRFYAHTLDYHKKMWKELHKADIARLLIARWKNKVLVAWVVFVFNKIIYYPYGASSSEHRELMASNLMMWEVIRLGKKLGCHTFDMWGALGPKADQRNAWYGFHRFKEGYGGDLMEFVGTYDLVLKPKLYSLYRLADSTRWKFLRAQASLRNLLKGGK